MKTKWFSVLSKRLRRVFKLHWCKHLCEPRQSIRAEGRRSPGKTSEAPNRWTNQSLWEFTCVRVCVCVCARDEHVHAQDLFGRTSGSHPWFLPRLLLPWGAVTGCIPWVKEGGHRAILSSEKLWILPTTSCSLETRSLIYELTFN